MRPEREHEKELGQVSLQKRKSKGTEKRKGGTPVPVPQSSNTTHKLIWEHSFYSSSFASVCLGTLLGHRR